MVICRLRYGFPEVDLCHVLFSLLVIGAASGNAMLKKCSSFFLCGQGSIPDMTSTTDMYLQLQRLYREQADLDISGVETHVHVLLKSIGRNPASIPRFTVSAFVKNARNLRCASTNYWELPPPVPQMNIAILKILCLVQSGAIPHPGGGAAGRDSSQQCTEAGAGSRGHHSKCISLLAAACGGPFPGDLPPLPRDL